MSDTHMNIAKYMKCIVDSGELKNFNIKSISQKLNIDNLRIFHNIIKKKLINQTVIDTRGKDLLDIACGRGGDIQKWIHSKLKYVFAFDSHKESIFNSVLKGGEYDGAISRFLQIKKNFKGQLPYIKFNNLDILDTKILDKINDLDKNKKYDIVSCNFALHYFNETSDVLNRVLFFVSSKLKKGGRFIGTATDGDLMLNILNNDNVNIPLLTLVSKPKTNSYLFYIDSNNTNSESINDIRKNYFEIQGVSHEYYLLKETLSKLAEKHDLILVEYKSFYEWYIEISKENRNVVKMTPYELIISFLNFSFIFIKK